MQKSFECLLQSAVDEGVSPGMVGTAFNRKEVVTQAAKGFRNADKTKPMEIDTTVWMASMSKAITSTVCLAVVEKLGFDIDSHEALAKYVPEIAKSEGNPFWKIFDGTDEKTGEWKYKDATVPCTLRHFLTHTSGVPYDFDSPSRKWWYEQNPQESLNTRKLTLLFGPRDFEAGEKWLYGENCEVYGLFVSRATGKTWRELLQEYIWTPLNISPDTLDAFRGPEIDKKMAEFSLQTKDKSFVKDTTDRNGYEGKVPADEFEQAGGFLFGSIPAYTIFARSLLNGLDGILSKQMFARATEDDLILRNLSINQDGKQPFTPNYIDTSLPPIMKFNSPHPTLGWTLLNTLYNRADADSGVHTGTLQWSGSANSYFFVDPVAGVGGVFACMTFPFGYAEVMAFREKFERWVIDNVKDE